MSRRAALSRRWAGAALAGALALGVAAGPDITAGAQEASGAASAAAGREPSGGVAIAVATLAPLTDQGASGEVSALQAGPTTALVVRLRGLAPGAAHTGSIRQGGCDGPVLFPLGTLVTDALGRGSATAEVPAPLDSARWWVEYRVAAEPPGPGVTCGPIVAGAAPPLDETERCPIRGAAAAALCQ